MFPKRFPQQVKYGVDDPIGAFPVHGACGAWGLVMTGLFDMDRGWAYGNGFDAVMGPNLLGLLCISSWAGVLSLAYFRVLNHFGKLRVSPEIEQIGLDHEFAFYQPPRPRGNLRRLLESHLLKRANARLGRGGPSPGKMAKPGVVLEEGMKEKDPGDIGSVSSWTWPATPGRESLYSKNRASMTVMMDEDELVFAKMLEIEEKNVARLAALEKAMATLKNQRHEMTARWSLTTPPRDDCPVVSHPAQGSITTRPAQSVPGGVTEPSGDQPLEIELFPDPSSSSCRSYPSYN